jgi:oxygen-independent coproporphyrinogen-3 oxidase
MGYTTRQGVDVVAFGPTAISELPGTYVQAEKDLDRWSQAVLAGRLATQRGHHLTADDVLRRELIRDVMCEGVLRVERLAASGSGERRRDLDALLGKLEGFVADGLVESKGEGGLRVTPLGRLFLRSIAMAFDAYLDVPGEGIGERKVATYSQTV